MQNRSGWQLHGRGDDQQGESTEMTSDAPSISLRISKIIKFGIEDKVWWYKYRGRIFGGKIKNHLFKSMYFI